MTLVVGWRRWCTAAVLLTLCPVPLLKRVPGASPLVSLHLRTPPPPPPPPCSALVEIQPAACVLDESAAEASSSSSEDEGEEVAAAQRARRAEAAAARPAGSTMPGWIGRLRSEGGRLWSPGRLAKLHAAVGAAAAVGGGWKPALAAAAAELAAGLAAAGLGPSDVASCKVYAAASLLGADQGPTPADLQAAVAAALPGVAAAVVPVTAVGAGADASDALLLEALALRPPESC